MIRQLPSNSLFAYATKGKAGILKTASNRQVYAYNLRAENNCGSSINVGLCKKYFNSSGNDQSYAIYQYVAAGPSVTEVTNAIAAGTATNIFDTTNNDGFIVGAHAHFNLLGLTISSASSGLTVTIKYWNGTSFTTLTTLESPVYSSTGDVYLAFQSPIDWVPGGTAGLTGLNYSQYNLLIQATTASSAVAVTALWVAKFLELYQGVANNGVVQLAFPDSKPLLFDGGEDFIPYFGTANAANQAGAYYSFV